MDFERAIMVMTLVSLALMLTGGYFVDNIPSFISWTQYLSPFKYGYDACLFIEFSGRRTDCDGSGKVPDCDNRNYDSVSGGDIMDFLNVQVAPPSSISDWISFLCVCHHLLECPAIFLLLPIIYISLNVRLLFSLSLSLPLSISR